jgi:FMN reductase
MKALGIVGTMSKPSRTQLLVEAVLLAAGERSAVETKTIVLGDLALAVADGTRAEDRTGDTRKVLTALEDADMVVIGTPVYRASYSVLTKMLLDLVPRGSHDGAAKPLEGKPVVVVATGGSPHHFLAVDHLTVVLHGFFAAHVVPPGVFASNEHFHDGCLVGALLERAAQAGRALRALRDAVAADPGLRAVSPQL